MNDDENRLLRALGAVQAAGPRLEPTWDPRAGAGVVYRATGDALEDQLLRNDLETLASGDYLERMFLERLSLCPNCKSHALNVHESCLSCYSSNLKQLKVILHFRCGFVGPVSAFSEEPQGRRCPKCRKLLQDLGTDHDSPGDYFVCLTCNATFQVAEVGARCLSCGARFAGPEMKNIGVRDIFAYRLTAVGEEALKAGRLLEARGEALVEPDGLTYRRHMLLEFVEDERRRRLGLGTRFGLIVLGAGTNGTSAGLDTDVVLAVRKALSDTDKLGRLDEHHLVAVLPGASTGRTKATMQQILELAAPRPLRAEIAELPDGGSVAEHLEAAAVRIDAT